MHAFNSSNNQVVGIGVNNLTDPDSGGADFSNSAGAVKLSIGGANGNVTAQGTITGNTINAQNVSLYGNGITYPGVGGANNIGFKWDGANVRVYVDNSLQGTIPNP